MDDKRRMEITTRNEDYVKQWFEVNGFEAHKMDIGNTGKAADWYFRRTDLAVVCEVKTIFSGAQSGITREQYKRRVFEAKERLERAKREIPPDTILLTTRDELDFAAGKVPYQPNRNDKEEAYNQFLEEIRQTIENDERIRNLPFDITISFSSLYVEYNRNYKQQFFDWLVEYALWAQRNHLSKHHPYNHSHSTFTFVYSKRRPDGKLQGSIEAFVQVWGPLKERKLMVGFLRGATNYNEDGVTQLLERACIQLRETKLPSLEIETRFC